MHHKRLDLLPAWCHPPLREPLMPTCLIRWLRSLRKPPAPYHATARLTELTSLRTAMLQAVDDCAGSPAQRLQLKIHSARNHHDLWMLRSDAYRLISLQHCQAVADQRISELLHLFQGWMAAQEHHRAA